MGYFHHQKEWFLSLDLIENRINYPLTIAGVRTMRGIKKRATHRAALKFYVTKVSSLKIKEDWLPR